MQSLHAPKCPLLVLLIVGYPKLSDVGSQKSPSRPIPVKMPRISSGFGRRDSACKRVEYHVVASVQS